MENNYETLRMPELKALTRERRLRGYSRLRKANLIAFLQNNERQARSPGQETTETSTGVYLETAEGTCNCKDNLNEGETRI